MSEGKDRINSLISERPNPNEIGEKILGFFLFVWFLIFTLGGIFLLIKLAMWVF